MICSHIYRPVVEYQLYM